MLKAFCNKIVACFSSFFKTEKTEYKQKLVELEERVQKSKIDSMRISIYPKTNKQNNSYRDKEKNQITLDTNRKNSANDLEQLMKPIGALKIKKLNISSIKNTHNKKQQQNLMKSIETDLMQNSPKCGDAQKFFQIKSQKSILNQKSSFQRQRASNNSQDSFHTMHSGSGSGYSISRRTFKSINSLKSSRNSQLKSIAKSPKIKSIRKKYSKNFNSEEYKSIHNDESSNSGAFLEFTSGKYQGISSNKLSQVLVQWNQKQYSNKQSLSKKTIKSTEISQLLKSKLNSNLFLDELINKLEDFYTFYIQQQCFQSSESNNSSTFRPKNLDSYILEDIKSPKKSKKSTKQSYSQEKGYYFNYSLGIKCSYYCLSNTIQSESYSFNSNKNNQNFVMKSIQFYCDTTSPINFLKWYNSVETRSKLFDFHKITLQQNGVYPILQAQQYSPFYEQKNIYTLVRQIQIGTFQGDTSMEQSKQSQNHKSPNQESSKSEYILQLQMALENVTNQSRITQRKYICYNKPWKNLLRFQIAEKGLVQIYYESAEDINKKNTGDYYKNKWLQFQDKLNRDKILKSGFSAFYN